MNFISKLPVFVFIISRSQYGNQNGLNTIKMKKKVKPTRLIDLAMKLNLSTVTISKALRDHPDISEPTIARVKKAAERAGYQPNIYARNLSTGRTNTIGLVVPKIAHNFFASLIDEFYKIADELDYEVILMVSNENVEREALQIQTLLSLRVDGIIISVSRGTKDLSALAKALKNNIPVVFVDRALRTDKIPKVMVDDKSGAGTAIEYAYNKGYRKIAHIGGRDHLYLCSLRHEGFIEAMHQYNVPVKSYWDCTGNLDEQNGYEAFMKMYKSNKVPEFILAQTYSIALGISTAATEIGIKIPEDVEIACFGRNSSNYALPEAFHIIDQPTDELARKSFELMLRQITLGAKHNTMDIILPTVFKPRKVFAEVQKNQLVV